MGLSFSPTTTKPPIMYSPLIWQPQSSVSQIGNASFIGGLQCDVYRSSASGGSTLSFSAQQSNPLYKARLPQCPGVTTETINGTCASTWNFTLEVGTKRW